MARVSLRNMVKIGRGFSLKQSFKAFFQKMALVFTASVQQGTRLGGEVGRQERTRK